MSELERDKRYIGVDGGASKTHVVVLDAASNILGEARGPAATLNGCCESAWSTITQTLASIDGADSLDPASVYMVVGIAGTEITQARTAFIDSAPPYAGLSVVSDAEIACAGAHDLADGAIVSVGTGVVGVSRVDGALRRAGGWGFPHDDRGGGAWLGGEAVHAALCAHDGRADASELSHRVDAEFGGLDELIAWACSAGAADFARLAPLVIDSAAAGDAVADRLLRRAASEVGHVIQTVAPAEPPGGGPGLPLALTGGMASSLQHFFDASLCERLVEPQVDAARGAALMARAQSAPEGVAV